MARYEVHRTDGNADDLRGYLEAHGATVAIINRPVDWAVGYAGVTALAEVKTPKGTLEDDQKAFLANWRGLCVVLRTEADCDALLQELRALAASARPETAA